MAGLPEEMLFHQYFVVINTGYFDAFESRWNRREGERFPLF